jgi:hypothetical protein
MTKTWLAAVVAAVLLVGGGIGGYAIGAANDHDGPGRYQQSGPGFRGDLPGRGDNRGPGGNGPGQNGPGDGRPGDGDGPDGR